MSDDIRDWQLKIGKQLETGFDLFNGPLLLVRPEKQLLLQIKKNLLNR